MGERQPLVKRRRHPDIQHPQDAKHVGRGEVPSIGCQVEMPQIQGDEEEVLYQRKTSEQIGTQQKSHRGRAAITIRYHVSIPPRVDGDSASRAGAQRTLIGRQFRTSSSWGANSESSGRTTNHRYSLGTLQSCVESWVR